MKKLLLYIILLISLTGFAQAEKDSLFAKNIGEIYNTLKVMQHLEREVMELYMMPVEERKPIEDAFHYYLKKRIIATNPIPSTDILRFLEIYIQKDIPSDWKLFAEKVNNTNAKLLLSITDKYGYPSFKRLKKYSGISTDIIAINFAIRPNRYYKDLAKMLEKEHKKGNVQDAELEAFNVMANRIAISTEEIQKRNKTSKKSIVVDNPY